MKSPIPELDSLHLMPDLRAAAERELVPDERILWCGQPHPARHLLSSLPVMVLGGLVLLAGLWWMRDAFGFGSLRQDWSKAPLMPLLGLPFLLAGLRLLSHPYWQIRGARRTLYVVTSGRAVIFQDGTLMGNGVRSFGPDRLLATRRREHAGGWGDILFPAEPAEPGHGRRNAPAGFFGIPHVKDVEALLHTLAQRAE